MGLFISRSKICNSCSHGHHTDSKCIDRVSTSFSPCACRSTNFMRNMLVCEYPSITGISLMFYPDLFCSLCTTACACAKCTCMKCTNKKTKSQSIRNKILISYV